MTFEGLLEKPGNHFYLDDQQKDLYLFDDLTLITVVAMKDELRPSSKHAVHLSQKGNIKVRLISGDNLETAKYFARQAKIINKQDLQNIEDVCMTAQTFRERVSADGAFVFQFDLVKFSNLIDNGLKVIARATPEDKFLIAKGLKDLNKTVAATGEGMNDVEALKISEVGFCMGSGVQVAKAAATVVLKDDNISSIVNSTLWGRNIYSNSRKFVQYQMTFNFSTLFIVFVGAMFRGVTVFSVVQLLWLNMIMDTLAAIALAAEKPRLEAIKDMPIKEEEQIITRPMWRQIIGTTLYSSVVMFLMFWFNEDIWGITYQMNDPWMDGVDPSNKTKAFTMLFNIFVYMHLFNMINCR